ncbi:MAG: XRE family transcriptional regulator, partial [Armatimonadetes bacterium]|nr:XRE family transcriptional regulator [Armatimonadota bacterium]
GIRIVNREPGSGSRQLLEQELARAGIPGAAVEGYQDETASPESAARQVVAGRADAAMSSACLATAFGLGFVPLRAVPYDLVLRESDLMHPPVQQLLGTLEHRWLRSQFQALGGCDTTETGTIVARVG